MAGHDAIKPRPIESAVLSAPVGRSGGGPPEIKKGAEPKKMPTHPSEKVAPRKRLRMKDPTGPKTQLEKVIVDAADREGRSRPRFKVPKNLTEEQVVKLFKIKGEKAGKVVTDLVEGLRDDATNQLVELAEAVKGAGGADRRSARYGLGLLVAKVLQDNYTKRKMGEELQKGPLALIPYFIDWTNFTVRGVVVGDPKSHIKTILSRDPSKQAQRDTEYEKYAKLKKNKLDPEIADKLGEELDQIAKWVRYRTHNDLVELRKATLRSKDPNARIPNNPQHQLMEKEEFPEKGLVAYLVKRFKVDELSQESLLKKLGGLSYAPYQVVSERRKKEVATNANQQKEAEPGRLQKKSKAEVERDKKTIDRQGELRPLMDTAAVRRGKIEAFAQGLEKDFKQPRGTMRDLAVRVAAITSAHKEFLEEAAQYMPPKDVRRWFAKAFTPKKFGNLEPTKLAKLKRDAIALDKRWEGLQDFINKAIVKAIPKEARSIVKLDNVELDDMDAKALSAIIPTLKSAFAEMRKKEKAPETSTEVEAYLKKIMPDQINKLRGELSAMTGSVRASKAKLERLKRDEKDAADFKSREELYLDEIKAGESKERSLNSQIDYARWIFNDKDPEVKMKVNLKQKSRADRLKDEARSYWGQGIR